MRSLAHRENLGGEEDSPARPKENDLGVIFIDTPGIDAPDEDRGAVEHAIRQADLALFIHSLENTDWSPKETAFLRDMQMYFSSREDFGNRVIPVLTKADLVEGSARDRVVSQVIGEWNRILRVQAGKWFVISGIGSSKTKSRADKGIQGLRDFLREEKVGVGESHQELSGTDQESPNSRFIKLLNQIDEHLEKSLENSESRIKSLRSKTPDPQVPNPAVAKEEERLGLIMAWKDGFERVLNRLSPPTEGS